MFLQIVQCLPLSLKKECKAFTEANKPIMQDKVIKEFKVNMNAPRTALPTPPSAIFLSKSKTNKEHYIVINMHDSCSFPLNLRKI